MRTATPTSNGTGRDAPDGKRVDSDRDLFSLGLSGTGTPAVDGAGNETPGHTLAETEALLAKVDERTQALSESEPPSEGTTMDADKAGDTAAKSGVDSVEPEIQVEDVSSLSREELEQKYKALAEKAGKADAVLKATSPILNEGIADSDALEGWIKMINGKAEMGPTEIKRLTDKLSR